MFLSIVCYLDEESTKLTREYQKILSELTGSVACLTDWQPHITVGDGIDVKEEELECLFAGFKNLTKDLSNFKVESAGIYTREDRVGGTGETTTPYCLGLDINVNNELLQLVDKIAESTNGYSKWYKMPQPYAPHATLAFKDLHEEGYRAGRVYIEDNNLSFSTTINGFSLVEKLADKDVEFRRFNF